LALALLREESFRKVNPLFQLANPLSQLIEFAKADLNIFQGLAALGRVRYTGLQVGPRDSREEQADQHLGGSYEQDDHSDADCPLRNSEHPPAASLSMARATLIR